MIASTRGTPTPRPTSVPRWRKACDCGAVLDAVELWDELEVVAIVGNGSLLVRSVEDDEVVDDEESGDSVVAGRVVTASLTPRSNTLVGSEQHVYPDPSSQQYSVLEHWSNPAPTGAKKGASLELYRLRHYKNGENTL